MSLKLEPFKDEILKRYDLGESCSSIATSLGSYLQPVTNLVKKYRGKETLKYIQGNVRYFESIDSARKAYFLGFIAADGCVQNFTKSSVGLSITIHSRDKYILEEFRKELECENPIHQLSSANHSRFSIANKLLVKDLLKYGIGPRKSLTLANFFKEIPEQFRKAAILGYFDGDGSITIQPKYGNRAYIQIRGTEQVLEGILEELEISSYHLSNADSIPSLRIGSKDAIRKFYEIYKICPVYLTRKYERFQRIFQQDQTIS